MNYDHMLSLRYVEEYKMECKQRNTDSHKENLNLQIDNT